MSKANVSVDHRVALARECVSGLMGIADWMQESGQYRKAHALRLLVLKLDEAVEHLCSDLEEMGEVVPESS